MFANLCPDMTTHRIEAIDWTRGVLMILMALDHAALYWYSFSLRNEGYNDIFPAVISVSQFFTRFVTHPAAPGFIFICGMMMSMSTLRRRSLGQNEFKITAHQILRGAMLIAAGFLLMPQMTPTFGILACIGTCMILWSFLSRVMSTRFLLIVSSVMIFAQPFFRLPAPMNPAHELVSGSLSWADAVAWVSLHAGSMGKSFRVLYPVLPWMGVMGIGIWTGVQFHAAQLRKKVDTLPSTFIRTGVIGLCLCLLFRLLTFYGDPAPASLSVFNGSVLLMCRKYPPSLAFLLWTLGVNSLLIGFFLRAELRSGKHVFFSTLAVFGRVPLFFYITHFHLYRLVPALSGTRSQYNLPITYLVWLTGLVLMYWLCRAYVKAALLLRR